MQSAEWATYSAEHPDLAKFWAELQPGFDAFERTRRVPDFIVAPDGSYRVTVPR